MIWPSRALMNSAQSLALAADAPTNSRMVLITCMVPLSLILWDPTEENMDTNSTSGLGHVKI